MPKFFCITERAYLVFIVLVLQGAGSSNVLFPTHCFRCSHAQYGRARTGKRFGMPTCLSKLSLVITREVGSQILGLRDDPVGLQQEFRV